MSSVLQKYYRTPKLKIKLPSRNKWYPKDYINSPDGLIEVLGMTAIDEIELETPDNLISGEASNNIIKSCCPSITDPSILKYIDYKVIMLAIKAATYGFKENVKFKCSHCEKNVEQEIFYNQILDLIDFVDEDYFVNLDNGLKIYLRPSSIKNSDEILKNQFKYQRLLDTIKEYENVENKDEIEEKIKKEINILLKQMSQDLLNLVIDSIDYILAEEEKIDNTQEIKDYINQISQKELEIIRSQIEEINKKGLSDTIKVTCPECQKIVEVSNYNFDPVNFFE